MAIFFVVVAIGVVVFGVLFWSMWKYRRSNNKKPATFTENHTVEMLWTIIPTSYFNCNGCSSINYLKKNIRSRS